MWLVALAFGLALQALAFQAQAQVVANDDDFSATPINASTGPTPSAVNNNDTLDGRAIAVSEIQLYPGNAAGGLVIMQTDGRIYALRGAPAGTYVVSYAICRRDVPQIPANCDGADATVVVSGAPFDTSDLAVGVSMSPGGPVHPGQALTFTVTTANNGPDARATMEVALANDTNLTVGTVSGGGCTALPCSVVPGSTITVMATVNSTGTTAFAVAANVPSGQVFDPDITNNRAAVTTTSALDIRFGMTSRVLSPGPWLAGQSVQIEVVARNDGDNDATSAEIQQVGLRNLAFSEPSSQPNCSPDGSCGQFNLAAHSTFRQVLTGRILQAGGFQVSHSVGQTGSGAPGAGSTAFGSAQQATDIQSEHRLLTPGPYYPGQTVEFEAAVSNLGPYPVSALYSTSNARNLRDIRWSGACGSTNCRLGSLNVGGRYVIRVTGVVIAPGTFWHQIIFSQIDMPEVNDRNDGALSEAIAIPFPVLAQDDAFAPVPGSSGGVTPSALLNDTFNGQPATVGAGGNVVLTPGASPHPGLTMNADGSIAVAPGTASGQYAYPYTLCEAALPSNCDSGTATVTVDAATLVAADDRAETRLRTPVVLALLGNDTLNGAPIVAGEVTLAIATEPANGSVSLNADGSATYVPTRNAPGADSFTYRICETLNPGNCATAIATILVGATAPTANPDGDGATGPAGEPLTLAVLDNDTDPDDDIDPASLLLIGGDGKTLTVPGEGTWTANPNGTLTFAPLPGFVGDLTPVQYTVADATGLRSQPASVRGSIVGRARLNIVKTAQPREARIGDLVRYTLSIDNSGDADAVDATVIDTPPPGFSYVPGSLTVADRDGDGRLTGNHPIRIDRIDIARGERATMVYLLRVGAGVRPGIHVNRAIAQDNGVVVSNLAQAEVRLLADPLLDESLILGTVFDDRNGNGWQDAGEAGIPGVRIASVEGLLIETDPFGRYHLEGIQGGAWERGRNFILKVDPATLPPGTVLTTPNPLLRRITPGLPVRFDFGARLPATAGDSSHSSTPAAAEAARSGSNNRVERATPAPTARSQERTP
nr:Ig-like domain-containing protein [Lysobacter enzymogenes]